MVKHSNEAEELLTIRRLALQAEAEQPHHAANSSYFQWFLNVVAFCIPSGLLALTVAFGRAGLVIGGAGVLIWLVFLIQGFGNGSSAKHRSVAYSSLLGLGPVLVLCIIGLWVWPLGIMVKGGI